MRKRLGQIKKSVWIRLGAGAAILLIGIVALWHSPLRQWITVEHMTAWVERTQGSGWKAYLFYLFFTVGVMALPVTPFPIIGGVLFDFWIALPMNLLATTAGATLSFLITRTFGREAVHSLLKGKLKRYDQLASARGLKAVIFLRWLGVPPFIITNYALGLSGVKSWDYIVGTLLGVFPWIAVMTYAAHSIWKAITIGGREGFNEAVRQALIPLIILSVFVLIVFWITVYVKNRKEKTQEGEGVKSCRNKT
ncbi:MAG: VTT domain-containing protein [Elusimicrobia bacterium]|nr:VTT domain-containing protein [Candidatus Obscuribacterium magneticum]